MAYIDYTYYSALYPNELTEGQFARYAANASRVLNSVTMCADGFSKLDNFFPTDSADAEAVRYACAEIVHRSVQLDAADSAALSGSAEGRVAVQISSGSESIRFADSGNAFSKAGESVKSRYAYLSETVIELLRGVKDANGVNLLYAGCYPNV